jgi:hypothetical protein
MDEPYFIRPGEGERIGERGHRVLAELPHIEALELSYGPDFEGVDPHTHPDHTDSFYVLPVPPDVEHGFRPCGSSFRLLNFHPPRVGFIEQLRKG